MKIKVISDGSPFGTHVYLIQNDGSETQIDKIVKGVRFEINAGSVASASVDLVDAQIECALENFQLLTPDFVCIEEKDGVKYWALVPSE